MMNNFKKIKDLFLKFQKIFFNIRFSIANIYVIIKTILLGFLFSETLRFSKIISKPINEYILKNNYHYYTLFVCIFCIILLLIYLIARGFFIDVSKVVKSKRFDVLGALILGIWIDNAWSDFFTKWYLSLVSFLNIKQILTIIFTPFVITILTLGNNAFRQNKITESSFITDLEIDSREKDLLNFTDKANKFAEKVINNGAPESFVFGVDAPWGVGKSTFINFCQEYWYEHYKDKIVVYKFSPLRYAGNVNLLEIFIDGLINAIQKDTFVPEIKPLISKYSRLLKEVKRFSFLGFNTSFFTSFFTSNYTVDEALEDLTEVLQHFSKKVIIIVDDLDRIDFVEIKNILFTIRKSFVLPNISYVLCYDTENICILEAESPETEKVSDFLEKFINIKISLYLERDDLANFVSKNLEKSISNKLVDPILVQQAIGGLLDIYKSDEYHNYLPFIGDVRKLKRLINTVLMFELEGTDFKNSDFDKKDLIHLLLIYIHYPNIFRKIYDTETNGNYGFFSVVGPSDKNYPDKDDDTYSQSEYEYKNSTVYHNYIKQFPEGSRQYFLLDQVFNITKRIINGSEIPEEMWRTLACFNGTYGSGRNLEAYLSLIVNLSKPTYIDQYNFYMNWKDEISNRSITIEEVFALGKFSYDKSEQPRLNLLRAFVNNARELSEQTSNKLITYLLDNVYKYSLLEISEIGLGIRKDIIYYLIRLLNDSGWIDQSGRHSNNSDENIKEIAEWIFGEGRHNSNGILEKLSQPIRGILGLYDLMLFRLTCSVDRGGNIFDLTRALAIHGNENAPQEGPLNIIAREEMREISQKIFQIFKIQYIDANKNIFYEVENLQLKELAGEYEEYIKEQIKKRIIQEKDIYKKVEVLKTNILVLIIYQLGNASLDHGVGCGFYDPIGREDKNIINKDINNYLFDFCFDPEKGSKNYECFLDYFLMNYITTFSPRDEDHMTYIPHIGNFCKVLNETKLANYWNKNGKIIKDLNLHIKEKLIYTSNYVVSYKEELPKLYQMLDSFIKEKVSE